MTLRFERRHAVMLALVVGLFALSRYDGGGLPFVPVVDDAPFPADGLHVLVVYQDADAKDLTSDQRAIMYGAGVRAFLDSACVEDGWRMLDAESDMEHADQVWKDAMSVPRESLPWAVASNGKTGFSGPLTMTPDEFKSLVGEHK